MNQGGIVVGHNVGFDLLLFTEELERRELLPLRERVASSMIVAIDTLALAKSMIDVPGRLTLEALCERYGILPTGKFHMSDVDARAAVALARKMMSETV